MPVTPDLPPGARSRMWILLVVTVVAGGVTYAVFGRLEILLIASLVLTVLIYLLVGVELTLRRDRAAIGPMVRRTMASLDRSPLVILDHHGVVLEMSETAVEALGHPRAVLLGQRMSDVLAEDPAGRVRFSELLRFGLSAAGWRGELTVIGERGEPHTVALRTLDIPDPDARRFGLIALARDEESQAA